MSEPVFPYGYNRPADGGPQGMGTMLTWEQLCGKQTLYNLHPEVQRRFYALINFAYSVGIPLGIGTGWRIQPPKKPGFAAPGNSWHESVPVSPTSHSALAIDTVPNVSWDWMENHCGNFGFRTFRFIGNEPWHIQPTEIPASRNYTSVPPPLYTWNLPGEPPAGPNPTPTPPATGGVFAVQGYRKEVRQGSSGKMAKMCQQQINLIGGQGLVEDGNFGSQSVAGLKNVQTVLGCTPDGVCGPQTWQALENGIKTQAEGGGWG